MAPQRTDPSDRDVVAEYVRKRLVEECRKRGGAAHIAKATGVTPVHVHNVRVGHRRGGDDFLHRIAEYWGMTTTELARLALNEEPEPRRERLPNLSATLVWCRGSYPNEFLDGYAKAARKATHDLSRREWLDDIDAQLRSWAQNGRIAPRVREAEASVVRVRGNLKTTRAKSG